MMIDTPHGFSLHVRIDGPPNAPSLMLSNSLCTTLEMWNDQMGVFAQHFRVIRYDMRGHGRSGSPAGPYTVEDFGKDVLTILDTLGIARVHWCGISLGGIVGQWLGANASDRIDKLVLSNVHSYYRDKEVWNNRIKLARDVGMAAAASAAMERWFTKSFSDRAPERVAFIEEMFANMQLESYAACCGAIRDMDMRPTHGKIKAQTLIIVGLQDPATPPSAGSEIQKAISGARLATIDASHISNVAQPEIYSDLVLDFLSSSQTRAVVPEERQ
jgi:3-oxoadipate enol-lactonase